MTRIYVGRDEWWPVPDLQPATADDPNGYEIDQAIVWRFLAASAEFMDSWKEIAQAAADAGDKYWQDNT